VMVIGSLLAGDVGVIGSPEVAFGVPDADWQPTTTRNATSTEYRCIAGASLRHILFVDSRESEPHGLEGPRPSDVWHARSVNCTSSLLSERL
jgi:hypothetical protein